LSLLKKIELVEGLAERGLKEIQGGAFVSSKWVPQTADSEELF
jgi:hydroxymethylglutaryl-CoA lyase